MMLTPTRAEENTPDNGPQSNNRRRLLLGIPGAFLAIKGLPGCAKSETGHEEPAHEEPGKIAEKVNEQANEASHIDIPSFEFIDEPIDQSLGNTDTLLATKLEEYFNETIPKLNEIVKSHPGKADGLIQQFAKGLSGLVSNATPQSSQAMQEFSKTWDRRSDTLIAQINKLLHPVGWHVLCTRDGATLHMRLAIFKVEKTSQIKSSQSGQNTIMPVYHLGENMADPSLCPEAEGTLGMMGEDYEHILYYEKLLDLVGMDLKKWKARGLIDSSMDLTTFRRQEAEGTLLHEAVHVLLAKKYPKATKEDVSKKYEVPLEINVAYKQMINLSGPYRTGSFHELCGVGAKIASVQGQNPLWPRLYMERSPDPEYRLVSDMVTVLTLKHAPDSPKKTEIVNNLRKTGQLNFPDLESLLTQDDYSEERIRSIGEEMYEIGESFLKKVEIGELN